MKPCLVDDCTWNPLVDPSDTDRRHHARSHTGGEIEATLRRLTEVNAALVEENARLLAALAPTTGIPDPWWEDRPPGCVCVVREDPDGGELWTQPAAGCPVHRHGLPQPLDPDDEHPECPNVWHVQYEAGVDCCPACGMGDDLGDGSEPWPADVVVAR